MERNQEARQTDCPKARDVREAVPKRGSPRPLPSQSPNSRADRDRIRKAGPRRDRPASGRATSMTDTEVFVGIDVCKGRLDVHVLPQALAFADDNDPQGIARLGDRLAPLGPALIVLEA